jgi:CRP-like cAMP-binding protein
MTATITPAQAAAAQAVDKAFPTLTPAQVARVAAHGRMRQVERGEILLEPGTPNARFFVVRAGTIEIVRMFDGVETLITVHRAGQFTGRPTCSPVAGAWSACGPASAAR